QLEQRQNECASLRRALADESASRAAAEQRAAQLESAAAAEAPAAAADAAAEIDRRLRDWLAEGGDSAAEGDGDVRDEAATAPSSAFGNDSLGQALNRLRRAVRNSAMRTAAATPVTPVTPLIAGVRPAAGVFSGQIHFDHADAHTCIGPVFQRLLAESEDTDVLSALPSSASAAANAASFDVYERRRFDRRGRDGASGDEEGPDDSGQGDSLLNLAGESPLRVRQPRLSSAEQLRFAGELSDEDIDTDLTGQAPNWQSQRLPWQQEAYPEKQQRSSEDLRPVRRAASGATAARQPEANAKQRGKLLKKQQRPSEQIRLPTEAELILRQRQRQIQQRQARHPDMLAVRQSRGGDDHQLDEAGDSAAADAQYEDDFDENAEDVYEAADSAAASAGRGGGHRRQQQRVSIITQTRPVNPWSSDYDDDDDDKDSQAEQDSRRRQQAPPLASSSFSKSAPMPRRPTSLPPPGPSASAGRSARHSQQQQQQQ
uniref:PEHE domain-containing protein n=1 Tax=Macrostomum lignano TaxID=282301 RepID=A0A1I8GXK5_9PLAT